jgi:hypothetical protein
VLVIYIKNLRGVFIMGKKSFVAKIIMGLITGVLAYFGLVEAKKRGFDKTVKIAQKRVYILERKAQRKMKKVARKATKKAGKVVKKAEKKLVTKKRKAPAKRKPVKKKTIRKKKK